MRFGFGVDDALRFLRRLCSLTVLAWAVAQPAQAQGPFVLKDLGGLPGAMPQASVTGSTYNGQVVGYVADGTGLFKGVSWTPAGGMARFRHGRRHLHDCAGREQRRAGRRVQQRRRRRHRDQRFHLDGRDRNGQPAYDHRRRVQRRKRDQQLRGGRRVSRHLSTDPRVCLDPGGRHGRSRRAGPKPADDAQRSSRCQRRRAHRRLQRNSARRTPACLPVGRRPAA